MTDSSKGPWADVDTGEEFQLHEATTQYPRPPRSFTVSIKCNAQAEWDQVMQLRGEERGGIKRKTKDRKRKERKDPGSCWLRPRHHRNWWSSSLADAANHNFPLPSGHFKLGTQGSWDSGRSLPYNGIVPHWQLMIQSHSQHSYSIHQILACFSKFR